jgi:transposase
MRALVVFLRFLLRVQGLVVEGGEVLREEDAVVIRGRRRSHAQPRCPFHRRERLTGTITRRQLRWRHLDLMGVRTFIECEVREGRCRHCDGRRTERVSWAAVRAQHTRTFDRRVASLVQVADKSATARMFAICWMTVGRIVERVVAECLPRDLLDDLVAIAVDETSHKRGHRYITVVTDIERNRVVWVGEGKGADTLRQFFAVLGTERAAKLRLVAMDMSGAYASVVRELAKDADIVFDRFHVVKLLLEAIDEVRRQEVRAMEGQARIALKRTRFALLRNPRHINEHDREAIARVVATNRRLTRAYQLRVDFEQLWECATERKAETFVMKWTRAALRSRLDPLRKFARTVRDHLNGILMFFRYPGQTSGMAEGMNNKIKLLIHKAYGFHNVAALVAMVYLCCTGIRLP